MSRQEGVRNLLLFTDASLQHIAGEESLGEVEPANGAFASGQVELARVCEHLKRRAIRGGWSP